MTTSPDRAQSRAAAPPDIEKDLRTFLEVRTKNPIGPDDDLAAAGVSSLFVMELVTYMENTYGIVVAGPDLMMENFRTVRAMVALVERLPAGGPGGPGDH
ncbi:acyl carrier protein [Actinomadura sp. 7K507]|uniref:acyl carrier protein n=1 Tax=Actinomadura sp. 7K507 TaxID=2530365 RepID=UPI00104F7D0E|nr:acyl carrier protein [Actinomadura sp. 7K507]TDC80029.1 acyl carrier protein [Actinomadura sp. 7K507]